MKKINENVENGSGIVLVLDSQDSPPGVIKKLDSKNYPMSFKVDYEENNFTKPEDIELLDQSETLEAIKRNLINRSNSLADKERMNRCLWNSILETIEKYNGSYDADDNSITMKGKDFNRFMNRIDNRIFGLDFLNVKFILLKEDDTKEVIYPQYDSMNPLKSPLSLRNGEILEGSKTEKKPYGETLFTGTINKMISDINKSITEKEVKLIDQSFITVGDYLAGKQKAKFYMRIESDVDSGNVPFDINFEKSKDSEKMLIDLDIMFEKLDYFNMKKRIKTIHIWADKDQEFVGVDDNSKLKEYIESKGYKANILEANSKEVK